MNEIFNEDKKKQLRQFFGVRTITEAINKLEFTDRLRTYPEEIKNKAYELINNKFIIKNTADEIIKIEMPEVGDSINIILRDTMKKLIGEDVIFTFFIDVDDVENYNKKNKPKTFTAGEWQEKIDAGAGFDPYIFYKSEANMRQYKQEQTDKKIMMITTNLKIPSTSKRFYKWYNAVFIRLLTINTFVDIFEYCSYTNKETKKIDYFGSIRIYKTTKLPFIDPIKLIQTFRDNGLNNCMSLPIKKWASEKLETAKSKPAISRYNKIIKYFESNAEKYENGVNENDIKEIADICQISICITLPVQGEILKYTSEKKPIKKFIFMNTRFNHVDIVEKFEETKNILDGVTSVGNIIEITETEDKTIRGIFDIEIYASEMEKIKNMLTDEKIFFTYKKGFKNINKIETLTETYILKSDYREHALKFETDTGLNLLKLCDIKNKYLCDFIREGLHFNGTVDFVGDDGNQEIKHIDMEKAYTAFYKSEFYESTKFPGKINTFAYTDKIHGTGLYKINNLDFTNADIKFKLLNDKMKIYFNNCVYPNSDLKLLDKYKVGYKIIGGCWGCDNFDFRFPETMKKKDSLGVVYYGRWCGAATCNNLKNEYWINGDVDYFNILQHHNSLRNNVKFYENGECCISHDKENNYNLSHITAFITSYQRINTLSQLMQFKDIDNIIRVCVDGIYYKNENVELVNSFRVKNDINLNNGAACSYIGVLEDEPTHEILGCDKLDLNHSDKSKILYLGGGGCGKTHSIIINKTTVNPIFIFPSYKLESAKKEEYGYLNIHTSIWAKVITSDIEIINNIKKHYNILMFDEISMMTDHQKNFIFKIYDNMKIYFSGDLGYQLPPFNEHGDVMPLTLEGFGFTYEFKTDYRCKCDKLGTLKENLRDMIKKKCSKFKIHDYVLSVMTRENKIITTEDELKKMYNINDYVICGTHAYIDYYNNLLKDTSSTQDKYLIKKKNGLYCRGHVVIVDKPDINDTDEIKQNIITDIKEKNNGVISHGFTAHTIQGESIKESKIFINSVDMFDATMFYTVISRARKLEQIYINTL